MTYQFKRPHSLREAARRVAAGDQRFDPAVHEFLDSFYLRAEMREAAIAEAPELLTPLRDAYLAAVAEHLAQVYGLDVPDWAERRGFDLREPYFAGGLESLKALLLVETPTAFRRRMLFVGKNAMSRASELVAADDTDVDHNNRPIGGSP